MKTPPDAQRHSPPADEIHRFLATWERVTRPEAGAQRRAPRVTKFMRPSNRDFSFDRRSRDPSMVACTGYHGQYPLTDANCMQPIAKASPIAVIQIAALSMEVAPRCAKDTRQAPREPSADSVDSAFRSLSPSLSSRPQHLELGTAHTLSRCCFSPSQTSERAEPRAPLALAREVPREYSISLGVDQ
jgi:hypothetical protein